MTDHNAYSGTMVRRAAWQFLTGKAASALLTFVILLWLVRLLPVEEYGAYAVLLAGAELGYGLSSLGLPWLAARYLPEYRLHAGGQTLRHYCHQLIFWQVLVFLVLVVVAFFALDAYLAWVRLSAHRTAALLALALFLAEGLGRYLRDALMSAILLQNVARSSLVLRQASFLIAIAVLAYSGQGELRAVLAAETIASFLGSALAVWLLRQHLRALADEPSRPGWQPPSLGQQWKLALRMHGANLLGLAYSPQIFLNLIQRHLGAETTALFGFLRTLQEQVARYLPATLLFTVLRPRLIATHIQDGMPALAREANFAGKLSLFVLIAGIILVALAGNELIALFSSRKFVGGGTYLLGLMLVLVPASQQQLIETVAVAAGRSEVCLYGAALALVALPLMLTLLDLGAGLWSAVVAMLTAKVVFNATVVFGLRRTGYRPDWQSAVRMAASAMVAWLAGKGLLLTDEGLSTLVAACGLAIVLFPALIWRMHIFLSQERDLLVQLLRRRIAPKANQ